MPERWYRIKENRKSKNLWAKESVNIQIHGLHNFSVKATDLNRNRKGGHLLRGCQGSLTKEAAFKQKYPRQKAQQV
jgi:hypothetical protein